MVQFPSSWTGFDPDGDKPILTLYYDYDRQAVRQIFEPEAAFTPGAGKWGLHGAIELPHEPGSFVFFVSFGRTQGEHEFDEGISHSGILRWQSQPRQALTDRWVRSWIDYDSDLNTIHLFLRSTMRRDGAPVPYTYLGELDYVGHDPVREMPVNFSWRLVSWPVPAAVLDRIQLNLENKETLEWETPKQPRTEEGGSWQLLKARAPQTPPSTVTEGVKRRRFMPRVGIDFELRSARARKLGELGEGLVVKFEKQRLTASGRSDLARQVVHVAKELGDGAGYDVLSFSDDGREIFIEVKTTKAGPRTDFLISANEIAFSSEHAEQYQLYRLFRFVESTMSAEFFVIEGDLRSQVMLLPTEYRATGFEEV